MLLHAITLIAIVVNTPFKLSAAGPEDLTLIRKHSTGFYLRQLAAQYPSIKTKEEFVEKYAGDQSQKVRKEILNRLNGLNKMPPIEVNGHGFTIKFPKKSIYVDVSRAHEKIVLIDKIKLVLDSAIPLPVQIDILSEKLRVTNKSKFSLFLETILPSADAVEPLTTAVITGVVVSITAGIVSLLVTHYIRAGMDPVDEKACLMLLQNTSLDIRNNPACQDLIRRYLLDGPPEAWAIQDDTISDLPPDERFKMEAEACPKSKVGNSDIPNREYFGIHYWEKYDTEFAAKITYKESSLIDEVLVYEFVNPERKKKANQQSRSSGSGPVGSKALLKGLNDDSVLMVPIAKFNVGRSSLFDAIGKKNRWQTVEIYKKPEHEEDRVIGSNDAPKVKFESYRQIAVDTKNPKEKSLLEPFSKIYSYLGRRINFCNELINQSYFNQKSEAKRKLSDTERDTLEAKKVLQKAK